MRRGIIEYLDAEEEIEALVAISKEHIGERTTHLEVDPASIFGLTFNVSVFPEHNSVGKHPISANFIKQSQGLYAINFNDRYDARGFMLYYPQAPIVNSAAYRTMRLEGHASGQNFVVALSTYYGYNMKDAIVLNKAAVDRGLGRSLFYKTYADEERRYPGGHQDHFRIPPPTTDGYQGEHAYAKLAEDGLVEEGMLVSNGDVLIGKVSPPRFLEEQTAFGVVEEHMRDNSVTLREDDAVVDRVMLSESFGATRIAKVRARSIKIPEVGDKFASRHGQKGVVALLVPQEDMPFTKEGLVPDMLLSPFSLPSRMTFGHMLEMLAGKAGSLHGTRIDGTPFSESGKERADAYGAILEASGFERFGDEVLYDGRTGKSFKSKIFTGVVYYNRLWHMVSLKLQVRSRGPIQILTHQPTEGKPRHGGIKFGEMEREALVGHGASLLLKDRMLEQSDKTTIWVCRHCGNIGYYDYVRGVAVCPACDTNDLELVETSYAFKLLLDEIKSMHILTKVYMKSG